MIKISKIIIMAFIVITVFSCNKIPNHAKYIPKNALGVFAIDMDKLSKKLIWNVLTGSEIQILVSTLPPHYIFFILVI